MYTGHFSAALTGAAASRRLPLWLLVVAAFGADIAEGVLAGFYVVDPMRAWSHSVPATAAIGFFLCIGWKLTGGSWRDCAILLLVAVSHSALDFVTAVKTMWPGLAPAGLGLYAHPVADAVVEIGLCVAGWAVWRSSLPRRPRAPVASRGMIATLVAAQLVALAVTLIWGADVESGGLSKFVR